MYGPSKLATLLGLIAVAAAAVVPLDPVAAVAPLDVVAADAPLNVVTKPNDGNMTALLCNLHYEVYEEDGCGGDSSTGMCNGELGNCKNLKGMGSKSITVGNNLYSPTITVIGYSKYDCVGEVQRITLSQGTASCLRYGPSFHSIKAQR
ncbi:hypothetical protein BC939DRAFT_461079 [Gamsiella multidivaricata]|uniref:uncharacterized protein n=1 Tax=Gamsiella multidivaricata TaxID=101098 RepID=UPI00221F4A28|nr:uncharacterized protein BC939DRAFT_461079 [Gamsiella multidivaricata]KAG0368226.1 hypothetical protein BGZ54_002404 [Gamsiella multidivaricata]KAI7819061.1 hypothetical protein BC939DRAFT_461079 [Gamsiella multidivaricata]